jgi:hypothetical protein
MIKYITLLLSTLTFGLFYKIDGHNIFYNYASHKYSEWKRLNNLVSTQHKSKFIVTIVSLKMVGEALYQSLVQYLDNSVVKINKNTYTVSYVINGKLYKTVIIPKRGPLPVLSVENENNLDVTHEVLPYLGPHNDWNNHHYTPEFFKHKKLKFELLNGEIKEFIDKDIININTD